MEKWWYCSTKNFQYFTYGKMYECVEHRGSYLMLINDLGHVSSPSIITKSGKEYSVNFMTPHQWSEKRTKKINEILGLPINEGIE
jgi:hypothetical protein